MSEELPSSFYSLIFRRQKIKDSAYHLWGLIAFHRDSRDKVHVNQSSAVANLKMAVDTDVVADAPKLESEKQVDDSIPLGGDEDEDEDPSYDKTFHPDRITLPTFRRLLACYATTAEQVYRRKMMVKLQPKPAKGSSAKLKKRAGSASATATGAALIQKADLNASEQRSIQTETDKYLELDQLRYEGLPKKVAERKRGDDGNEKNGYLSKDDLFSIMEWKMYVDIS